MPSQPTPADELQKTLMHANRLCPALRRVFLLCDIRGFAIAETAAILGISSTAVTIRLDRARREMNARLNGGETRQCMPSDENQQWDRAIRVNVFGL